MRFVTGFQSRPKSQRKPCNCTDAVLVPSSELTLKPTMFCIECANCDPSGDWRHVHAQPGDQP